VEPRGIFDGDPVAALRFSRRFALAAASGRGVAVVGAARRVRPPGMKSMKRLFRAGFAAHLALVVAISIGAYTGVLPTAIAAVPQLDKLGHAILIGGLAFFLDGALGHRALLRERAFPRLAPVLVLMVAGIEEYAQRFSSRRSSSWGDYAADVVGVCFFTWLSLRVDRAVDRRRPAAVELG
jgi:hypothetical protein